MNELKQNIDSTKNLSQIETLGEALAYYTEHDTRKGSDHAYVPKIQKGSLGKIVISELTPSILHQAVLEWKREGRSLLTISARLRVIRHALQGVGRHAEASCLSNEACGLVDWTPDRGREAASDEEMRLLLAQPCSTKLKLGIILAYREGFKRPDICSLNWSLIDISQRNLRWPGSDSGHGKRDARVISLDEEAIKCLTKLKKDGAKSPSMQPQSYSSQLTRVVAQARLLYEALQEQMGRPVSDSFLRNLRFNDIVKAGKQKRRNAAVTRIPKESGKPRCQRLRPAASGADEWMDDLALHFHAFIPLAASDDPLDYLTPYTGTVTLVFEGEQVAGVEFTIYDKWAARESGSTLPTATVLDEHGACAPYAELFAEGWDSAQLRRIKDEYGDVPDISLTTASALGLDMRETFMVGTGGILMLQELWVYPKYRGNQLGLRIINACLNLASSKCSIAVLKTTPYQFVKREACNEPLRNRLDNLDLGHFSQNIEQASSALTSYYSRAGFKQVTENIMAKPML